VLVGHVLLRSPPVPRVARAAQPVFAGLSRSLAETAVALRTGDADLAEAALLHARDLDPQVRALAQALSDAQDLAQLTLGRRNLRERLQAHEEALRQLDLAVRPLDVAASIGADPGVVVAKIGIEPLHTLPGAAADRRRGRG
jgi:ABC-type transporter Mla subunit MlaD